MPTIEIVSLGAKKLGLDQKDFKVAIIEQNKLKSHRGLFYKFLETQKGVMIHIGNPSFRNNKESFFFAGKILNLDFIENSYTKHKRGLKINASNHYANQELKFKISNYYFVDLIRIIEQSIQSSPQSTAYFLTDYQFGPENANYEKTITLSHFIEKHDKQGLNWNTLYEIKNP